ncbi:MAG TPA: GGDEF domain-containing protein [Curvibacter sp.]|nr:GGDEF domain-containing protein [Curvibacter sp.]
MQLHTPTLLLVNLVVTLALGVSMGVVARRARRDGMVWWAWAMVAQTLAFLLLGLRGQVSDWLSVVLANTLMVATFALFSEGLCEFQHRRPRRWLIWTPVLLLLAAQVLLLDEQRIRPLLSNAVMVFQAMVLLQLILSGRRERPGRGQYFVAAGFLLIVLALLLRLIAQLAGWVDLRQVTESNPVHALSLLMATLIIVIVAMGLVLMSKERADALNRNLALQDELTGLHNRRSIQRLLDQQLAMLARGRRPLAVLLIDVDHFKRINDTHGHLSGDLALREIGACLLGRLRGQDLVGRWGGEEFIALLPDTGIGGARKLAEQLRRAVEQLQAVSLVGKQMPLTVSIGLCTRVPDDEATREDVIALADRALYQAKQNGRNRVEEA